MFWNISRIYFFFCSIQNIKRNCYITFLIVFPTFFSAEKSNPSQLYLFIKGLIFVFLCGSVFISSWFNTIFTAYWKHLLSFLLMVLNLLLLFCFLSNKENVYMIRHDCDLFYGIYNTIVEHNQRQNHYLLLIPNYSDIYFSVNQKVIFKFRLLHH